MKISVILTRIFGNYEFDVMNKYIISIFLSFSPWLLSAQYLTGVATYYNDSFIEWRFYTELEEEEGDLRLQWEDDWSEWDYRLGDISGSIQLKWKDKPDEWELRGNNKIVTARTIWNGDFTEWRIKSGSQIFTLQSKWKNQFDVWSTRDSKYGNFSMETNWERDPRDWNIFDELNDDVDFETKVMMMFIVIFHSSPKQ